MGLEEIADGLAGNFRTTQGMVVGGLRDAILSGALAGGQPLRQEEIAEAFGVSRSPVREALRQLEGEGMVSFAPHRGAVVSELSYEEISEITEIRVCLETMALRESFPLLNSEDLERAEEVLHAIDHEKDLVLRWSELNWRFHATLFAPANRPRLLALIKSEHSAFERYIRVHLALSDYERPQREHYELLEICRRKDPDAAAKLLAQHIRNTGNLLFAHIREDSQPGRNRPTAIPSD